ncbi:excalibur calcium-binding domain-containing protein [Streptomyces sp. NBC_01244]|uniref:excalibur calcium-binding domain-containing protein n=1 Tax=Streptomyces sp. NBC_01244 TaxID=2903797 RepID=UPI002E1565D7|nr:excalibur calcium-binding domain-containing protein [Streptomyces sp. NBC_01244]
MGAAVLLLAGCGEPATPKGKDSGKPASAPTPTGSGPSMPGLIGKTSAEAGALVAPVLPKPVEARSAYDDVPLAADHGQWTVCFQTPAAGTPVAGDTSVEISLVAPGIQCPAAAGASLHPPKGSSPAKTPVPSADPGHPKPKQPKSSPTPAPGPRDVHYKNCTEAKAAGAAPIRRGEPGYGKHLDRDGDGIACDK